MAEQQQPPTAKQPRQVSVTITIRVNSISQDKAIELENAIRDQADDFGAEVLSNYSNPVTLAFGG